MRLFIIFFFLTGHIYAQEYEKSNLKLEFPVAPCSITELTDSVVFTLKENIHFIIKFAGQNYVSAYLLKGDEIFNSSRPSDTSKKIEYFDYKIETNDISVNYTINFDGSLGTLYPRVKNVDSGTIVFDGWAYYYNHNKLKKIKFWKNHKNGGLTINFNKKCEIENILNWYAYDSFEIIYGNIKTSFWEKLFR